MRAAIVGISGLTLRPEEAAWFRAHPPAGIILFARNIADPGQLSELVTALRRVLLPNAVMMVDQEGGRVARLRPPHWRDHPPAAALGRCFDRLPAAGLRAAWLTGALIGRDCAVAGLDVAATPVLDLSIPGTHDVIGDRALSRDPTTIARLGRAVAAGLLAAGVQPVGKHAPGHGRARVDSHLALPRVEANDLDTDFRPFALNADLPWMMTAHIVYPALDPIFPATLSRPVIDGIVRGRFGFKGVLVTDDLAMQALTGTPADLACQALAAGCDVALYCSGDFALTRDLLARCPPLSAPAAERLAAARAIAGVRRQVLDPRGLAAERDRLLA
jgi:beta-N-acetylhexosaminidase